MPFLINEFILRAFRAKFLIIEKFWMNFFRFELILFKENKLKLLGSNKNVKKGRKLLKTPSNFLNALYLLKNLRLSSSRAKKTCFYIGSNIKIQIKTQKIIVRFWKKKKTLNFRNIFLFIIISQFHTWWT